MAGPIQTVGQRWGKAEGVLVRVVEFTIDDGRDSEGEIYRLFTTLVDPGEVTSEELALSYAQRWEIEIAFGELKTAQRGPRAVLRSKSPDLVLQEIWGHLCCHYAIRTLMWEAALDHDIDPDRVSFTQTLRIVRRSISAAHDFSPSERSRLGLRHRPDLPVPQPAPTSPVKLPTDQTQDAKMACQTSQTRQLATTTPQPHPNHPTNLTYGYCGPAYLSRLRACSTSLDTDPADRLRSLLIERGDSGG